MALNEITVLKEQSDGSLRETILLPITFTTTVPELFNTTPSNAGQPVQVLEDGMLKNFVARSTTLGDWIPVSSSKAHFVGTPWSASVRKAGSTFWPTMPVAMTTNGNANNTGVASFWMYQNDNNYNQLQAFWPMPAKDFAGKTVRISATMNGSSAVAIPTTMALEYFTTKANDSNNPLRIAEGVATLGEASAVNRTTAAGKTTTFATDLIVVPSNVVELIVKITIDITALAAGTQVKLFNVQVEEEWVNGTQPAYVSPTGNDANSGLSPSAPKATLTSAAAAIGGNGCIVMQAGDYVGTNLNYANMTDIRVVGQGVVNVFLGTKVLPSAWTLASGSGASAIYKATTVAPGNDEGNGKSWVHEWGRPEGVITNLLPLEKGQTHRLPHTRYAKGSSSTSLAAGQWFHTGGELFIRPVNGVSPVTNNNNFWVPSTTATNCFLHNTGSVAEGEKVQVHNVRVFFGYSGVSLKCGNYTVKDCLFYGNYGYGSYLLAGQGTSGVEYGNEYAANGQDGSAWSKYVELGITQNIALTNIWAHDNGDQGVSAHGINAIVQLENCLLENNRTGGAYSVQDSTCGGNNITTRDNLLCGVGAAIASTSAGCLGTWTNWTSIGDFVGGRYGGAFAGTPRTYFFGAGCEIGGPWTTVARNGRGDSFQTITADDIIQVAADFVGDKTHGNQYSNAAGPGTVNFL
jgi:hypothetical protein